MWQVSVICVPTMTGLYPTPMLWCGVRGQTVKKKLIVSSRQLAILAQNGILGVNSRLIDALSIPIMVRVALK